MSKIMLEYVNLGFTVTNFLMTLALFVLWGISYAVLYRPHVDRKRNKPKVRFSGTVVKIEDLVGHADDGEVENPNYDSLEIKVPPPLHTDYDEFMSPDYTNVDIKTPP